MSDSTACLVGAHATYIKLPLDLLSAGKRDMRQDDPVASHSKLQLSPVYARANFLCIAKNRSHTGMRHIAFKTNVSPGNRSSGSVREPERDRIWTNARRRNFVLDIYNRHRPGWPGTSHSQARRRAGN